MNLNHWADGAWSDGSWVPASWGGVAEEEVGIGLAPINRPVDFVIQSPLWRQGFVSPLPVQRPMAQSEMMEMMEMMQLYGMWNSKRIGAY